MQENLGVDNDIESRCQSQILQHKIIADNDQAKNEACRLPMFFEVGQKNSAVQGVNTFRPKMQTMCHKSKTNLVKLWIDFLTTSD